MLALEAAELGVNIHRCVPAVSSMNRGACTKSAVPLARLPPLLLIEVTGAKFLLIHASSGADHAGEQRFLRHFEREYSDGLLLGGMHGDMLGDVQRQRRFSHGGPRGQNHQLAFMQAAGHVVQLEESGAEAFDALARIEKGVDAALEFIENALAGWPGRPRCGCRPASAGSPRRRPGFRRALLRR